MMETIIEYEALLKLTDWDLKRLSVTHLGDYHYSKLVKAGKIQVNKIKWHKTVNLGDGLTASLLLIAGKDQYFFRLVLLDCGQQVADTVYYHVFEGQTLTIKHKYAEYKIKIVKETKVEVKTMIDKNLIGFTTSANGYTLLYNGKELGGVHFTEMPKGNMSDSYNYCYELALAEIDRIVVKEEGTFAKAILNEVARFQNQRYEIELTRKELDIITDALNPHGDSAGDTARLFKKLVDIKQEKKN